MLDLLRDPAVLVPVGTFILGFGVNAAKTWIRARLQRRVAIAELHQEWAKRTPDATDDEKAAVERALAQGDLDAFEQIAGKADNSMMGDLLRRLTMRR